MTPLELPNTGHKSQGQLNESRRICSGVWGTGRVNAEWRGLSGKVTGAERLHFPTGWVQAAFSVCGFDRMWPFQLSEGSEKHLVWAALRLFVCVAVQHTNTVCMALYIAE